MTEWAYNILITNPLPNSTMLQKDDKLLLMGDISKVLQNFYDSGILYETNGEIVMIDDSIDSPKGEFNFEEKDLRDMNELGLEDTDSPNLKMKKVLFTKSNCKEKTQGEKYSKEDFENDKKNLNNFSETVINRMNIRLMIENALNSTIESKKMFLKYP